MAYLGEMVMSCCKLIPNTAELNDREFIVRMLYKSCYLLGYWHFILFYERFYNSPVIVLSLIVLSCICQFVFQIKNMMMMMMMMMVL